MKILVLNCGSSSVKYQLIETSLELIEAADDRALAKGSVERIGTSAALHSYQPSGGETHRVTDEILEHTVAIERILKLLADPERGVIENPKEVEAVGHRVVHGGEHFARSVLVDADVIRELEECSPLAPLHNPHNLRGYRAARRVLGDVPHVAVFDTAFHQTMEAKAYLYGLPYVLYRRHGIRRYGFHGTSHRYVSWRCQHLLGRAREELRLITCHLGNGASLCAIDHGRSVETSMGFTPLEGLLMGSRCGDIDPSAVFYAMHKEDLALHQVTTMLNKHSGLYGVSGVSNDMAEVLVAEKEGHERAHDAVELFCHRVRKTIGAYAAVMGGVDAVIFTAGIGERAPEIRARCVEGLEFLGLKIDAARNAETLGIEGRLSSDDSTVDMWCIPTDEERIIARDTLRVVKGVL